MENNILDINEFMSKTKFSINERFTLTHFNILPEEYEAFCYKMTISYLGEGVAPWGNKKYYIGWHKGNIEDVKTQKYISSSKEINEIIVRNDIEIQYDIIAVGNCHAMATLEQSELKKVKAKSNPSFFNKNQGGGLYVVSPKNSKNISTDELKERLKRLINNILNRKYPETFYDRNLLFRLRAIQVRLNFLLADHVQELSEVLCIIDNPKDFDPICVLLSEDGQKEKSIIINGNNSVAALKKIKTLSGFYAIEVPYEEWKDLSDTDLRSLGMALNPRPEKISMATSKEDAAAWVVSVIQDKKLYSVDKKTGEMLPQWTHDYIKEYLTDIFGFKSHVSRGEITKVAKRLWEENIQFQLGNNFLDFSDKGLDNHEELKKWYDIQVNSKKGYNYDLIIKASAGINLFKRIFSDVFKTDPNTKALIGDRKSTRLNSSHT